MMADTETTARLQSIDMLRGLVIVLMALDHVRDFFGPAPFQPEDLAATTPAWFWTRWITHLCATVFVFLAGTSAWLRGAKGGAGADRSARRRELSRHLATRGAMLVALEWTWISFSWQFGYEVMIAQVIWALGMGMIALAGLVWLPRPAIAAFAAALILGHNALDGWRPGGLLWQALHQGGFYPLAGGFGIVFMYPLVPWVGLMAAGYASGPVFALPAARRQRLLLAAAGALLLAFALLRAWNVYGDPQPWSPQGRGWMFDLMSFARVHKYPPSLQYLCVTGAIGLALLALFERVRAMARLLPFVLAFGRSPLFFYTIHIALIHLLAGVLFEVRFGAAPEFVDGSLRLPDGYTPSLPVVYAAWVAILFIMYGLTRLWQRRRRPLRPAAPAI
ncbi:DUF1624 domain-containing protein [Pseudoduganella namucuonensis]|uniref:Uncharacterized membrane protein n=1 Tax=Pseudoduganella namucuonensis TaxID=1035707 RepID=A0A1I7LD11_9BURK|nr:heparan-alpha-glucosaminide N-acetyltransferase domain-containing protein [Pseudoduganella namucuonensis]SFV07605.1 Uncharacterized membrane protein [Pseudoduganella namucuonensis]